MRRTTTKKHKDAGAPVASVDEIGTAQGRLLDLCADIVARAHKRGAKACEAYAEHVQQTSVNVEQNELKGASSSEHEAVGIRVFVAGAGGDSTGFAYVNRLDDAALDAALDDAIAIARASPGDPANALVEPVPNKHVAALFDPAIASMSADELVRLCDELLETARGVDGRVSVDNASVSGTVGASAIATSTGVRAAAVETAATWGLFGMAIDGEEVGSFDHVYEASRSKAAIDVEGTARSYAERVLALLHPVAGRTYKGKVLFSPDAFDDVFLSALFEAIDGDAVFKQKSRLKDKLGQRIASPGFLLVDDGTIAGGIGSASFDREGLPHRRTVVVGDGLLHAFFYDGKSARRAGKRPTGHAQGSARSIPGIGTTNVRVGTGSTSERALLDDVSGGIFVGRFSGDVDSVSGDFSGVAKGSFLVDDGARGRPMKETLIAGNLFDALLRIVAIGDRAHRNMTTTCPWILVDGIDVTAGAGGDDDA